MCAYLGYIGDVISTQEEDVQYSEHIGCTL